MKTISLKKQLIKVFAIVILFFAFHTVNAQNGNCINSIPNLTEQQKTKIQQLQTSHKNEMATLRQQKQSATTIEKRAEVEKQMIDKRTAHYAEIRSQLTDPQKTAFDQYIASNNGKGSGNKNGKGGNCGKGNGNGKGCGGCRK